MTSVRQPVKWLSDRAEHRFPRLPASGIREHMGRDVRSLSCFAFVVCLIPAVAQAGPLNTHRVPCEQVISLSTRLERRRPSKAADTYFLARKLGVNTLWIERCMDAYGRRLSRRAARSDGVREVLQEAWESAEPVEKGEPGEGGGYVVRAKRPRVKARRAPSNRLGIGKRSLVGDINKKGELEDLGRPK